MKTSYEWAIEEIDNADDICDVDHTNKFAEAIQRARGRFQICLVRDIVNDNGSVVERSWAYLQSDNSLPSHFEDSRGCPVAKVPQRFHDEVCHVNNERGRQS